MQAYTNGAAASRRVFGIRDASGRLYGKHHRHGDGEGKKVRWSDHTGTDFKTNEFPFYGSEHANEWDPDEAIILVEGEKARDALDASGRFAVLGTLGTSHLPADGFFEVLRGREVIGWADGDDRGREHMDKVLEKAARFAAEVRDFTWHEAPEGIKSPDAADHPAVATRDPGALDRLLNDLLSAPKWEPEKNGNGRIPTTISAAELLDLELAEPKWAIPNILPEGVTILGGKPKMGKSWFALGVGIAVASGGYALGSISVDKGSALVLALEDNPRRFQRRLRKVLAGSAAPAGLEIATEWPRLDEGGVEDLDRWLQKRPDARLVVVDTLKKIRPRKTGNRSIYDVDYEALEPLLPLAAQHGVAVQVVHHLNKLSDPSDPFDAISGSTGLTGGVDGAMVLKRERGEADAALVVDGRDIEEPSELALEWDQEIAAWKLMGAAAEYRMSKERREILDVLRRAGEPMGPKDISDASDVPYGSVRVLLSEMVADGSVDNPRRGSYTPINNVNNNALGDAVVNGAPDAVNNATTEKPVDKPNQAVVNDVGGDELPDYDAQIAEVHRKLAEEEI